MAKKYRVLRGLNYGPGRSIRREVGDVVDDLPEASVPWLLEQGHIQEEPGYAEGGTFHLVEDMPFTKHTGETLETKPRGGRAPAKE